MIDVDQAERDLDAAASDDVIVGKSQMKMIYAEIRAGQEAQRALVKLAGTATVLAAIGSVRVPNGYQAADRPLAA